MFTSFWIRIKTYPKRRDYLVSFILNLDLFTSALENLYVNTLAHQKWSEEFRLYYKSRGGGGGGVLYTDATGSHRRGMKEPRVTDPCATPNPTINLIVLTNAKVILKCICWCSRAILTSLCGFELFCWTLASQGSYRSSSSPKCNTVSRELPSKPTELENSCIWSWICDADLQMHQFSNLAAC